MGTLTGPKEVLQVNGSDNTHQLSAYALGEACSACAENPSRSAANPGINATVKDRYFNSASAAPALVFPVLLTALPKSHMRKLSGSSAGACSYSKNGWAS